MEIKTNNDTVWAAASVCDTKIELPIETEILIPDYLPQVFKIVKCFVHPVVMSKQMMQSRLTLDGYLRLTVFYQSDGDDALCQTEQKLPFAKQIDLPSGEFFAPDIAVNGDTEYVNCRAINQRRIDIRGAYALNVSAHAQTAGNIITELSEGGVEQKLTTLKGMQVMAVQEKVITVEDVIDFETPPDAVLDIKCNANVTETKIISGKAVLKGTIDADILYRCNGLHHTKKVLTFNDVLELDGVEDTCESIAFAQPCGCTLLTGENGTITLGVTAILHIKAHKNIEMQAVCDAFSTQYETQLTFNKVYTEEKLDEFAVETEAVTEGTLPDINAEILEVFATSTQPELIQEECTTSIRGRVIIHMFCRNALNEIDCYDKACEYVLPYTYADAREDLVLCAQASVMNASAKRVGDTASAAVVLRVSGIVSKRCAHTILEQIECTQTLEKQADNIALRIYYAQTGEPLFDIARRYAVSPASIAEANCLQGDIAEKRMRLLVPSGLQ